MHVFKIIYNNIHSYYFFNKFNNGVKKYVVNINNLNLKSYMHNTYMIEK